MTEYNVYDADGNVIPASNTYALVKARFEQEAMSVRGGNVEVRTVITNTYKHVLVLISYRTHI